MQDFVYFYLMIKIRADTEAYSIRVIRAGKLKGGGVSPSFGFSSAEMTIKQKEEIRLNEI